MEVEGFQVTRRRLLMLLSVGAGAMAALAASVPIIGFLLSPMLRKFPPLWQDVGPLEQFNIGETVQVNLVTSVFCHGTARLIESVPGCAEIIKRTSPFTHPNAPIWVARCDG